MGLWRMPWAGAESNRYPLRRGALPVELLSPGCPLPRWRPLPAGAGVRTLEARERARSDVVVGILFGLAVGVVA